MAIAYVLISCDLGTEKAIIDEMNKLGTSEKDNKRYEVLKAEREKIVRRTIITQASKWIHI